MTATIADPQPEVPRCVQGLVRASCYLGTWESDGLRLDMWRVGFDADSRAELAYRLTIPRYSVTFNADHARKGQPPWIVVEAGSGARRGSRVAEPAFEYAAELNETSDPVTIEGRDFRPAPSIDHASDESAGGLIGFYAAYADPGSGAERPEDLTTKQTDALAAHADELAVWAFELEGE